MRTNLSEALPPMIPEFPVEIAGHHLTLRFDVNINKTKKGVKLQFVMNDIPQDPREAQQLASEIGTELQQKFVAQLEKGGDSLLALFRIFLQSYVIAKHGLDFSRKVDAESFTTFLEMEWSNVLHSIQNASGK